jgi:hypothetical protein
LRGVSVRGAEHHDERLVAAGSKRHIWMISWV